MKRIKLLAIPVLALLLANCATPSSQPNASSPAAWLADIQGKSRLIAEIHGLLAVDQFERNKIVALLNDQSIPVTEKDARVKELGDMITRNDRARTARLKEIFLTTDLTKMAEIDRGLAGTVFMIIIHAVDDLPFQKSQLPIAFELAKKGIIGNQQFAILTDKIAVTENRPQVYGSQVKCENGITQVSGQHDLAAIVAARADIRLEPLEDYLKHSASFYGCGG
jgi:hypothetical protein